MSSTFLLLVLQACAIFDVPPVCNSSSALYALCEALCIERERDKRKTDAVPAILVLQTSATFGVPPAGD